MFLNPDPEEGRSSKQKLVGVSVSSVTWSARFLFLSCRAGRCPIYLRGRCINQNNMVAQRERFHSRQTMYMEVCKHKQTTWQPKGNAPIQGKHVHGSVQAQTNNMAAQRERPHSRQTCTWKRVSTDKQHGSPKGTPPFKANRYLEACKHKQTTW